MVENPLVSIIIPTFNRYSLLVETLNSVLGQSYSNIEVIIVSDASSDDTANVLNEIADKRLLLFSLGAKSNGPAAVRNFGVSKSSGTLIAFCDDDDLWRPDKLEKQVNILTSRPEIAVVGTNVEYINDNGSLAVLSRLKNYLNYLSFFGPKYLMACYNCIVISSSVVRREVLTAAGGFNEADEYQGHEDNDLWLKICSTNKICIITENLTFYRVHSNQISTRSSEKYKKHSLDIMRKHYVNFNILQKLIFCIRLMIYTITRS